MTNLLIAVEDLAEAMLSDRPPVVCDVRWSLLGPSGESKYREGHLPGAVFVDLDSELAAPASVAAGRHPLPAVSDLQAAARRWGIADDSPVVVYDDSGNLAAARLWWLLRWAGFTEVMMLDGGIGAWEQAGFRLSRGNTVINSGTVTLSSGHLPVAEVDEVVAVSTDPGVTVLLDSREERRYRGEFEPVDPRAGHIPGAINLPTTENIDETGRFLPPEVLRERFAAAGITPGSAVITYCGSGINAAHQVAALALAGIDAALYPGSWSQYCADDTRPTATA